MRRITYFLILIGLVAGSIFSLKASTALFNPHCAFCNPAVLDRQLFYQDDLVLALYTHKPIFPGHCLIIPRRHVERFEGLSKEEESQMSELIKKVNRAVMNVFGTSAYLLLQKNGHEVGQTVPHVHFHYIPRKAGDRSSLKFILKMYLANLRGPISSMEMHEVVEKMKQAMK
ncbi:MAG: HIT family protein [Chlamydiales bacterium]|jgi:diadenosine tetraphosphate (Ap4A) HIT family hydrolase|nr:HIT family protein [Chlamydiales bacterium]